MFKKLVKKFKKEVLSHKSVYLCLLVLLALATFFRVFRTDQVLGFYFDQGRDALVIADLLEKGKWFLIGPTTGIAGIFRGPFYYYLIAPFYLIGNGNPLYPALFLAILSVAALVLLYFLAKEAGGRRAGIIAVVLAGFSYYIIYASRWLSNPTPMLLLSLLLVTFMVLVNRGKQWAWVAISFTAGTSLFHFGSSGEFFYFPALLLFTLWQIGVFKRKIKLPNLSIIVASVVAFVFTAAPLVLFDLKHEHILSNNLVKFLVSEESFKASFWDVVSARWQFLSDVFYSKIFLEKHTLEKLLMVFVVGFGVFNIRRLIKSDVVRVSLLLFLSPWIGLPFFQGNEGNIYDYYLTGYYLIFILLFAVILSALSRYHLGKLIVVALLYLFLKQNTAPAWSFMNDGLDGPNTVAFGNQKQAMDWIFEDAQGAQFNIDAYVPPVIPYTYTYLGRWYTNGLMKQGLIEEQTPLLYTLYEVDPPHPERLEAWLKRQEGIGKVLKEQTFGGITVQRRIRL